MENGKIKVFIDGKEGTTGLKLYDRLALRRDVEMQTLEEKYRKDFSARKDMLNAADYVFLCLPDAAALEAADAVTNAETKIIDASTAHRTAEGWTYGFPEFYADFALSAGKRIAVPGCHASGCLALCYPLIKSGVCAKDYPFSFVSVTGFSGGGKKMIAEYEELSSTLFKSPRQYGVTQEHKHLKEIKSVANLARAPVFMPYVAAYYSGMQVTLPLYAELIGASAKRVYDALKEFYANSRLISVGRFGETFAPADALSGFDNMKITVGGNDERILLTATFDNLGKGASGAALQCFNLMSGADECEGLNVFKE